MAWAVEKEQYLSDEGLVQGKTLGELLERYRDDITPQKKSHRTEHNRLNKFLRHSLATLPLADVRQSHFDDWIRAALKEIKSSSVNRDLNLWSAVFEQGKRWQWTDRNPIRGIQRPKNPPHRDCRITEDIQDEIVFALGFNGKVVFETRHLIAVAFLFALETAMRQGEIWGLDWKDVHLDQRYVRLNDTKNGTRRDVPLSTEAVRLLKLLKPSRNGKVFKMPQASAGQIFRRTLQLAGITGLTFHDTRYEALTRLARKLDVLDLARMVGHRDPRALMVYCNATAEEIARRLD